MLSGVAVMDRPRIVVQPGRHAHHHPHRVVSGATTALVVLTALGAACSGGALYAFSSFVMPALARMPSGQGVAAMQSINVTAVRAPFMLVFTGSAILCLAVAVVALRSLDEPFAAWLLAGVALYVVGCFVLTIAYHVPRNDALALLAPDAPGTAGAWRTYLREWTVANHVRVAAALLSAAALVNAVRVA
jgi:uncharacterized membrane protein